VGAHDFFGASTRLARADRIEQRAVDEDRMTMTRAGNRAHDRRVRAPIPIDDSPNRLGCKEGHVDERGG